MIALYARVSTKEQEPEVQLGELRAYALRMGEEAVEYTDVLSGRKSSRPALNAMLEACRKREVTAVVVVRLDRLARSLAHMATLGDELRGLGVELVSLREAIDTSTAPGRAMFGMCGVFAQLEADLIRDRTLAGLAAARKRGSRLGRPRALDAQGVARARRLRSTGQTLRSIAEMLGVGRGTVERAVS